jgi:hypothetical protein
MTVEFTAPLSINKCKLGDSLIFSIDENTPSDFWATVYSLDGNEIYTPGENDFSRNGKLYWSVDFSESNGFEELEYYELVIEDLTTSGQTGGTFIIYIGNQTNFDSYITRALGLSGHNMRKHDHVWVNGLLTEYKVSIYTSLTLLNQVENGGTDSPTATYLIEITYDNNYNATLLTSKKQ